MNYTKIHLCLFKIYILNRLAVLQRAVRIVDLHHSILIVLRERVKWRVFLLFFSSLSIVETNIAFVAHICLFRFLIALN